MGEASQLEVKVEEGFNRVDIMFNEPQNPYERPSLMFLINYTKGQYTDGKIFISVSIHRHTLDKNNQNGPYSLEFPYPATPEGMKDAREDAFIHAKSLYNLPPVLVPTTGVFPVLGQNIQCRKLYRVKREVAEQIEKLVAVG